MKVPFEGEIAAEKRMTADGGEIIELAGRLMPADPSLMEEVRLAVVSADEYIGRFQERLSAA